MKRILMAVFILNLVATAVSFAENGNDKASAAVKFPVVNGMITKLDKLNVVLKGADGKEYTFRGDNKIWKDYKPGDIVAISYEKDNLRAIETLLIPETAR